MLKSVCLLLAIFFTLPHLRAGAPDVTGSPSEPKLAGAWESTFPLPDGGTGKLLLLIQDGYFAMTSYTDTEFLATLGGKYRADWETMSVTYDFDTSNPAGVGTKGSMPYELIGNTLIFNGSKVWTRIDDNSGGKLAGAWLITGRKVDGEMTRRPTSGPRKTMKILSGSRFQWIAYNEETGEFFGTGGGRYTTTDNGNTQGLYTEHIDFFSRDNARVGDQLSFDWKMRNQEWHHSGQGSTGKPLYETWGRRKG